MSRIALIVNPIAGRGRAGRKIAQLRGLMQSRGIDCQLFDSHAPGDIERIARELAREDDTAIVVAGGDGSIHEAANGMLADRGQAVLGVVPIGTGNDFAKACGIPLHWEDAATLLADRLQSGAPARVVDVGRMNQRYFVNGAGIGFDAIVSERARRNRLPLGDLVYLIAVFQALSDGVSMPDVRLTFGAETYEGPLTLASICNGGWVGGLFEIAPPAKNDDGEFDLVVADIRSRMQLLALLPRLFGGTHLDHPRVFHSRVRTCEVVASKPLPSHLDGELQEPCSRFEICIIEGGLRLL